MTTNVISARQDESLWDALNRMWQARISGLPVVGKNGDLLGLITKRDIYGRCPNRCELTKVWVSEAMQTEVLTAKPGDNLDKVAGIMLDHRINRLPVVENGRLVGIITRTDMMATLAAAR
jgi:IMP dehydrogenase